MDYEKYKGLGKILDLPGYPEILRVWDVDYDRVLERAREIVGERPEEERETIRSVEEIEDVLDVDEVRRLVAATPDAWYLESHWPGPDAEED